MASTSVVHLSAPSWGGISCSSDRWDRAESKGWLLVVEAPCGALESKVSSPASISSSLLFPGFSFASDSEWYQGARVCFARKQNI